MSSREVYLNAIPPQFNNLPFQIPATNPPVQPYKAFVSPVITIPANTTIPFYNVTFTILGAQFTNEKVAIGCQLADDNYSGQTPFGIASWVENGNSQIIVSFWNTTNADKDVVVGIVNFTS